MFGPDHPQTLANVHNLSLVLQARWENRSAEIMLRRAAEGRRKVLGPNHPDTLTSEKCLAAVIDWQEDMKK